MKVLLLRNLFLGGNRYRASTDGTEVPDFIEGKKVVLWEPNKLWENEVPLPRDAKLFGEEEKKASEAVKKGLAAKAEPKTLSELNKKTGDPLAKL